MIRVTWATPWVPAFQAMPLTTVLRSEPGATASAVTSISLADRRPLPTSGRVAHHHGARRNVSRHHCACADESARSDRQPAEDHRARADRGAVLDHGPYELPVLRALQRSGIVCGTRVEVVDEHDAVPHEHLVPDLDAVTDERVALDLAASADRGAPLDL